MPMPRLVFAVALSVASVAFAQTPSFLKEGDVTEDGLKKMLTPRDSSANPGVGGDSGNPFGDTVRSFRPRLNPPAATAAAPRPAQAAAQTAERPSASILMTFETNSAELTPLARQTLEKLGRAMVSNELASFNFGIEGHADPRGGAEFNLRLSEARAEAVRRYLIQRFNIAETRLSAIGKGDRELANLQNPYAAENRRVTIVNLTN